VATPNLGTLSSPLGVSGLTGGAGTVAPLLTASGGSAGVLPGTSSPLPASTGAFVSPAAPGQSSAASAGTPGGDAFPLYSPMAGQGMTGQQLGQDQERERTTWLTEDEDVWGTEPAVGPQVIGRSPMPDEEPEDYDVFAERAEQQAAARRAQARQARQAR
jgi:hypothetical protein